MSALVEADVNATLRSFLSLLRTSTFLVLRTGWRRPSVGSLP